MYLVFLIPNFAFANCDASRFKAALESLAIIEERAKKPLDSEVCKIISRSTSETSDDVRNMAFNGCVSPKDWPAFRSQLENIQKNLKTSITKQCGTR